MSLFGTSPDESPAVVPTATSRSLFDDEPSLASGSKSSLFADDDNAPGGSPWGMPSPNRASKGDLIASLLSAADIPDSYIDAFDEVRQGGDAAGGKINGAGVAKVLSASKLSRTDEARIMDIIAPNGRFQDMGRNEFNVLLALIGLAQEQEEITLDGVDERRQNLPQPKLPSLRSTSISLLAADLAAKPPQRPSTPPSLAPAASILPQKPRTLRNSSMDYPDADPWASPDLHKGHKHDSSPAVSNGVTMPVSNGSHESIRTTSAFTTASEAESEPSIQPRVERPGTGTGVWGSYNAQSNVAFTKPATPVESDAFGPPGRDLDRPVLQTPNRSFAPAPAVSSGPEENIIVTLLPEKEGMFMFQHHNYHVTSHRRGSKVVRRYSDFVWLLDCLQKRFPFRQIPLLPPKRVGVNGSHLAADSTFIEKRRRGLARFANALVRHPVLSQEQLVVMFLTVPTELSVWRKQATFSVQEEFAGKSLPPGLEDSLPPSLNDLFETTRSGVRRSADLYINLCNTMDRLTKRNEGLAADYLRLSHSIQSLTDASQDTYATDTNYIPLVNNGLQAAAKHMSNSRSLLEDETRAWDLGVLEDLKRQRDTLVSMRDVFERRDRYDRDNIPQLEKRVQSNEAKLVAIRGKPEGLVKPGEVEKVTETIIKDKQSIVAQHARGVFVKECVRDELIYFQTSQFHVSRWSQDWAQERVKYAELQADNWKQLQEELESMPTSE